MVWAPRWLCDFTKKFKGKDVKVEATPRKFSFDDNDKLVVDISDEMYAEHIQPLRDLIEELGRPDDDERGNASPATSNGSAKRERHPCNFPGCGMVYSAFKDVNKHVITAHGPEFHLRSFLPFAFPPGTPGVRHGCGFVSATTTGASAHARSCPHMPEKATPAES
jgi:hypothetical protein